METESPILDIPHGPDPTANVVAILDAAVRRQDDLRLQESAHIRELLAMRAAFDDQLSKAETQRIDAIRAVDVGAVNRAAEVSATQAATLAAQVTVSAETLRTQVSSAATAATVALAAALEPIQKDIADLRRAQYEQQGQKVAVSENAVDKRGNSTQVLQIIAAVIAVLGILVAFYLGYNNKSGTTPTKTSVTTTTSP